MEPRSRISFAPVDLGDKALAYAGLPCLAPYVVLDSRRRRAVGDRRGTDGAMLPMEAVDGHIETPYGSFALGDAYDGVDVATSTTIG